MTRRYNRRKTNKGKKKGGTTGTLRKKTITPSPLRRGYSVSTGRNDEFVVEDIDDLTSLDQCKRKYRLLKFGYDVYEKRNAELIHQLEKLKMK